MPGYISGVVLADDVALSQIWRLGPYSLRLKLKSNLLVYGVVLITCFLT